ncbi:MAG TPA: DUF4097 family beta strand repeat-containing protein [Terriglobales bacterium]|nr:DUF4097 family beta strand repeat-containing protein [Terriglobales bacterium]
MASPTPVTPPPYYRRRRSLAGPLVLIIIGVFFLLITSHVISWPQFGHYFARYWPLLLILWGGIRLAEYYTDKQHGYPARGIGAGGVLFLILLIICGLSASTADRLNWQAIQGEIDVDDNFFGGMFGQTFNFNATQQQDLPAGLKDASLRVLSDRGNVTIKSWDDNRVKVDVTKKIRANDQNDANQVDQQTQPTINIDANVITVNANTSGAGSRGVRTDMEIWVPRALALDVATRNGDVIIASRQAGIKLSTSRGDINVSDITGNIDIDQKRGDIQISKVTGDVNIQARADDTTIAEVNGSVKLNGEYLGGINLSKITKPVTFHSSRTDMEFARLDGDFSMDAGDLRANKLAGPMRVLTRSKDVHLDDFAGDLRVENANSTIEVHSTKLGTMEIDNRRGDVQIFVPDKSTFQADLRARNGEITSDFDALKVSTIRNDASATGAIGNGGPKLQVTNEHGNIEIKKAGQAPQPEAGKD